MTATQYTLINDGEREFLTVVIPGQAPLLASNEHPNYNEIRASLEQGEYLDDPQAFADLFDVAEAVARRFEKLSERVSVANGQVYLDGDVVDDTLTQQIVRFLDEGVDNWRPLVAFMENVQANPNEHSRSQLYAWLRRRDFAITGDGRIVAYKGVARKDKDTFLSLHAGPAIINGQEHTSGQVPQQIGDVIELPRTEVMHDPQAACSTGLHVGTYDYAKSYARSNGAFLKVLVNPRDVVSVPTGDYGDKVRVCRYEVADLAGEEIATAIDEDESESTESRCLVCNRPYGSREGECSVGPFEDDDL